MFEEIEPEDQVAIESLICDLKTIREINCADCGTAMCGHEALMSVTMGFKMPRECWKCLSDVLEQDRVAVRNRLFTLITRRVCYNEGWLWANREEGFEPEALPDCLWPAESERSISPVVESEVSVPDIYRKSTAEWDAGDMGCGDLVLELRTRMLSLKPGQVMRLVATNPGAEEDLPAWCRMTGNTLITSRHPVYMIRRKTI